ncbi:autotransporter outer membrane beta-barrel domain-containing protein [Megasphaera stantonii]|uniref:autotransporter outer membrane beta-barrel domain-containing protein n=1 Tax=Megasphaera stantonii TaxID=2144175 RepID=UPI00320A81DE
MKHINLKHAIALGLLLSTSGGIPAFAADMNIADFNAQGTDITVNENTHVEGNGNFNLGEHTDNSIDGKNINVAADTTLSFHNVQILKPNITGSGDISIVIDKQVNGAGIQVNGNITADSLSIDTSKTTSVKGIYSYGGDTNINVDTLKINAAGHGLFITPDCDSDIIINAEKKAEISSKSDWVMKIEGSNNNVSITSEDKDSSIMLHSDGSGGVSNNSSGGKINLKAGSITVDTSHYYGVIGTAGDITLEATNGDNTIQGGQAGLRNKNGKVQALAAYGSNNISLVEMGTMGGVQSDSGATADMIVQARDYNRVYADEFGSGVYSRGDNTMLVDAGIDNIITGVTGIKSTGTGTLKVIAGGNNIIGVNDEGGYIGEKGIDVTNGTIYLSAQNNIIQANGTGVSVNGADSYATLNGKNNVISVINEENGDVTGISVTNDGHFNLSEAEGFDTESVIVEAITNDGAATGIYVNHADVVTEPAIGEFSITVQSATNNPATGIELEGNSEFTADVDKFTVNALGMGKGFSGESPVAGIKLTSGNSLQVTAQNGIEINAKTHAAGNYGNAINATGIEATTSDVNLETITGDIVVNRITDIEDINYSNIGIMSNMGANVTLTAQDNVTVSGITGISVSGANTTPGPGTGTVVPSRVELNAGNKNTIYATVDGMDVHGNNKSENNSLVELNGKINNIIVQAMHGSMDLAHGIVGQEGATVNIKDGNGRAQETNISLINTKDAVTNYGVDLSGQSTLNVKSDSINIAVDDQATSTNIRGLSLDSSIVDFDSADTNVSVNSDSNNAYGIYAMNGSTVRFTADNSNTISAGADGIRSFDSNISLKAQKNNNSITGKSYGIYTMTGLGKYNTNTVDLYGVNNGITATSGTGVYANGQTTTVDLEAKENNIIQAGDVTTVTNFGTKYGINASNSSTVILDAGNQNAILGAVFARGAVKDSITNVTLDGASNVIQSAAAIAGAGDLNDGRDIISSLYAEDGAQISVSGAQNVIRTYAEDPADPNTLERTIWAYNTADITIDGQTYISTDRYEETDEAQKGNSADIAIAAGTATGLNKDLVDAYVPDRATVSVKYDTTSTITGDILSAYAGQVDITPKNDTAQMHITGNILAGNNGVLNVNLGNGGTLTGRADDYGDAGVIDNSGHGTKFFDPAFSSDIFKGGEVNLTMGNNSRWNVTGQSWITRINTEGSSNAIIDLVSANTDRNASAHALTIYEMNGDAVFNMSLDADRTLSDMVYMKNANGEYVVNVVDPVTQEDMYAGRSDGGIFDGLRFATVGKGSTASFRAITWDQGINNIEYEVGTDSYDTSQENHHYDSSTGNGSGDTEKPGSDLVEGFFDSEGTPGAPEANGIMTLAAESQQDVIGTDTGANGTTVDETTNYKLIGVKSTELSDAGKTVVSMSRINYSNAVYMDRLNKRMGEARYLDGDEGLWVRMRHDRIGKSDAFRSMNTMMELGYDRKVGDREDGEHRQGFALDYMRGTADYKNVAGEGDVRRAGVWFYDTWLGDKGHYTDYVLKFGRLSNDFEVYARSTGEKITGDYSNFVYSASAEYGRKKDLGNDWYIEPQAQIQYAHVTDADYTTSQGTNVQLDAIDSLIGRVGFRLGKDMGEKTTFYVKADILHEFLGDQDIEARDATGYLDTTYENEGTWYDVGLGFSHQFSKGTYMFLDMEKTFGNDNEDTYQFNFGMNWKV